MAFDREAAKAEGYTDDEINAYLQAEAEKAKQATPVTADPGEPPAPTTKFEPVGTSAEAVATTGGIAVAPYVLPAAAAGAAALGGSKLYSGWKAGTQAAEQLAAAKLASEAGIADREFVRQGVMTAEEALARQAEREAALKTGKPVQAVKPVAPTGGAPVAGPVVPQGATPAPTTQAGRPFSPQAQQYMAQQAQPASMQSRVQAAAANKIQNLPAASMMGSAGRMAGKLLPGVGTALNAADAYNRYNEGDYAGAALAGLGAATSPFPILGTAVGAGTGAINAYRDYLKRQEEEKKRMTK